MKAHFEKESYFENESCYLYHLMNYLNSGDEVRSRPDTEDGENVSVTRPMLYESQRSEMQLQDTLEQ